jgi:MFS transporter, FSR family, fosmidomycin resistance protein
MIKMESVRKAASGHLFHVNLLHILNDGFQASFILLLPFIAKDQALSLTKVGLLGTILNVSGILLAIPAGYIAAKIGGLKTLIIALFIYGIALLGAGSLGHYGLLIIMFSLAGIGFGVFHPIAFALIAKWSPKESRGRIIGNFTAIGDVGRIGISAALSFVAVSIGWQQTAIAYAVIVLFVAFGFYRFLIARADTIAAKEHKPTHMSLWQIAKNKRYVLAVSAGALDSFASASLFVFLPFLLLKRGVSPAFLGTFTAAFFIGNFFGKTVLGRFVDKFGNSKVFIASEFLMAAFIFALANSTALYLIVLCSLVLGVFTKGTVPVQQTMVTESVEHHGNFEKAFGLGAVVSSSAITAAPIILGYASDKLGIVAAFNIMAVVALIAVIPAVWYFIATPNRNTYSPSENVSTFV